MHTDDLLLALLGGFAALALALPIAAFARTTPTTWLVHTSARITAPDVAVVLHRPDPVRPRPIVCGGAWTPHLSVYDALRACALDRPTDLSWSVRNGRMTDLLGTRTDAQRRCVTEALRFRDLPDGRRTFALSAARRP
jgi:hypothetical protein